MMLRIFFGVLTALLLNNCSNKNTVSQLDLDVLAQVGNKIITKQDFIRRAEYTIRPDYCRQSNYIHKKIVLNSLIAEKLTALEMEDKEDELLESKNFHYFLQGRKEQAMRKLYYYDNFYNKVSVPDSLIKKRFKVAGRTVDISYISLPDLIFVQKVNDLLLKNISLEDLEMELIDGGLEELEVDEEAITIYCEFSEFSNMQKKLEELNIDIQNSELQRIPLNTKTISAEEAEEVVKLLDLLEENDDVQQVFHNMELTEEILLAMEN